MIDIEVLKRTANNVRAAYYGENCVEAQYIDLAAKEIKQLREVNRDMYEACLSALGLLAVNNPGDLPKMMETVKESLMKAISKAEGRTI